MKVVFHDDFRQVYTRDPAAEPGRLEAVLEVIGPESEFIAPRPAPEEDLLAVHGRGHLESVRGRGLYDIAALAAGAALEAAHLGLAEPAFGLVRPPGHHASADSSWGFCYFNNMAVALSALKRRGLIASAYVLDIDLHYGDGTENILGQSGWAVVYNVEARDRDAYLPEVTGALLGLRTDLIGISAGFDMHRDDWGGRLDTEDYYHIGRLAREAAAACGAGLFAVLEGGYNRQVLGQNVQALTRGMAGAEPA